MSTIVDTPWRCQNGTTTGFTDSFFVMPRLARVGMSSRGSNSAPRRSVPGFFGISLRIALVARLVHERRLGQLLFPIVKVGKRSKNIVIPDDNKLPDGVSRNLSMHAQDLARAPSDDYGIARVRRGFA
jgi:hypothetical protein